MRPSELLGITDDEYSAYCLDSACAYIAGQMLRGRKPRFPPNVQLGHQGATTNADVIADLQRTNKPVT